MRSFILALALVAAGGLASATTVEPSINVTFPDEVAGLPFAGRNEFPQKELGVSIGYMRGGEHFARAAVYVYNGGLKSGPDDVDAPVVRKHFTQVIGEVQQLAKMGQARSVTLLGTADQTTSFAGCGPQFIWRGYEMDIGEAVMTSYTYLTGLKGQFVKLRVSHRKGDAQGARDTDRFVQEIRKVLGRCPA